MIRKVFFYLVAGPWTVFLIVVGLVLGLLPRTGNALVWLGQALWTPVWLWAAGAKVRTTGAADQLDPNRPYVFVSNHQSYFDIPATLKSVPHKLRFIAKKELLYIPLFGLFIWRAGCPIIDRGSRESSVRTLDRAVERIRSGIPILVYAEGTRTRDGSVGEFKRGAWILAIRAGVPVVPITVDGSFNVMSRYHFAPSAGTIRVHVGEPIPTEDLTLDDRHELSDRVREIIVARLEALRAAAKREEV